MCANFKEKEIKEKTERTGFWFRHEDKGRKKAYQIDSAYFKSMKTNIIPYSFFKVTKNTLNLKSLCMYLLNDE